MPSVNELSSLYGNFMLGPQPGPAVCEVCFDLTDGHSRCYGCANTQQWLDAVVPISYSIGHEQLHHALACYKRQPAEIAHRFEFELAAVLWRYLRAHEPCVARAAETDGFEIVTTVPSSSRGARRDPSAAADRRRVGGFDARTLRAPAAAFKRTGAAAHAQPREVQDGAQPAPPVCPVDRRHVDHGGQRTERCRSPEAGGRGDGRRGRHRPSSEPLPRRQRSSPESATAPV